jgi:hypothetical protein
VEQVETDRFGCEACGKSYRWKEELAGRRVKCKCGHVMTAPAAMPTPQDDLYEMAPEPEKPRPMRLPLAPLPAAATTRSPATATATLAYRSAPVQSERETGNFIEGSPLKDFYVPVALMILGTIAEFALIMNGTHHQLIGLVMLTGIVAVLLGVNVGIMLLAILIAAKAAGMGFGHPLQAIIKLAAIAISVAAVADFLAYLSKGVYLGWGISLLLYMCLFMWLFDLDWSEARIVVFITWVLNIGKAILLVGLVMSLLRH